MPPVVSISVPDSWRGERVYGSPERRSVARTSNSPREIP